MKYFFITTKIIEPMESGKDPRSQFLDLEIQAEANALPIGEHSISSFSQIDLARSQSFNSNQPKWQDSFGISIPLASHW